MQGTHAQREVELEQGTHAQREVELEQGPHAQREVELEQGDARAARGGQMPHTLRVDALCRGSFPNGGLIPRQRSRAADYTAETVVAGAFPRRRFIFSLTVFMPHTFMPHTLRVDALCRGSFPNGGLIPRQRSRAADYTAETVVAGARSRDDSLFSHL